MQDRQRKKLHCSNVFAILPLMKIQHTPLFLSLFIIGVFISCKKENKDTNNATGSSKYNATAQCKTLNADGSVNQTGPNYTYVVTMQNSGKTGFDYHFLNFTGDSDTAVYALKVANTAGFSVPSQQIKTSSNVFLDVTGSGTQSGDSLNYTWNFYYSGMKTHECSCKAKRQ